jgi:hypothetical protein
VLQRWGVRERLSILVLLAAGCPTEQCQIGASHGLEIKEEMYFQGEIVKCEVPNCLDSPLQQHRRCQETSLGKHRHYD